MSSQKAPNVSGVDSPGRRTVYSVCGMCAVRCPIQVEVESGRVTWLQGNPNDRSMGTSLCAKGGAGLALEYDDERPQYPMIRTGPRGSGQWRRASWDEALDYITEALKGVINDLGPRAIALSDRGGPFADLTKSFLKALGSPNYFNHDCTCGRNAHHASKSIFGLGRKGVLYDIANTKHIVLYGRNIIESLQVKEAKEFANAVAGGVKCTYIDPRATLTASKATRFWQIRPNTEYALNLAMINVALFEELYDRQFVAQWVSGLDYVRDFVHDKTPEWQEQYTGIPAAEVRSLIREIAADAPRVMFHAGWMTARHGQSFYTSRSTHMLNALFGNLEVNGGLLMSKSAGDFGVKGLNKLASRIPDVQEKRVDGCGWKYKQWESGPGLFHLLYPALETGDPYEMGAYICYRHDPLTSLPDPEAQKKLLDKLRLIVSIDVNYSETGWFSDVILPEATFLERANILAGKGGKKPFIMMRDQAVAPRFDSRPAWWIFREVARRLGAGEYFDFENIEELWDFQLEGTGITINDVREKGVVNQADKPIMWDRENGLIFKTPSGKIEFKSSKLDEYGLESLVEFNPPQELGEDQFYLLFGRSAVHNHGHTANNPLLNELLNDNPLWMHPDRAARLGVADGETVEVSRDDFKAVGKVRVTPWIHQDAVFMLHGMGRTVPLQSRAYNRGIADQRLQTGLLGSYDKAGGGLTLTECIVRVQRA